MEKQEASSLLRAERLESNLGEVKTCGSLQQEPERLLVPARTCKGDLHLSLLAT